MYLVKDLRLETVSPFGFEDNTKTLFSVQFPKDVINDLITEMVLFCVNWWYF